MPIRLNPFRKQDENVRPHTSGVDKPVINGTATQPVQIKEKDAPEYKLSEINDSGVFMPPSPPERKSFWTTSSSRSTTSTHRSLFSENEPFNISRESFDSYRRSFDIPGRSPIIQPETKQRASLDSRTFQPLPRHSNSFRRPLEVPGTQQEEEHEHMEDVALEDPKPQAPQKKRGMFSRIMDSDSHSERPPSQDGANKAPWHHFTGRKRGQSGSGAELGSIPKREETPKPDSQLKHEETAKPDSQASTEEMQAMPGAQNTQTPEIKVDAALVR